MKSELSRLRIDQTEKERIIEDQKEEIDAKNSLIKANETKITENSQA